MLREYRSTDLELLIRLLGDSDTMQHLGGPESRERIEQRHVRYLDMTDPDDGSMFVIEAADGTAAGSIGYWSREWHAETVWESGWFVLAEYRGQGLAGSALRAVITRLGALTSHRDLHAFPSTDNPASNAVCASAGFELVEALSFEYPKGHMMRCNDWRLPLAAVESGISR